MSGKRSGSAILRFEPAKLMDSDSLFVLVTLNLLLTLGQVITEELAIGNGF